MGETRGYPGLSSEERLAVSGYRRGPSGQLVMLGCGDVYPAMPLEEFVAKYVTPAAKTDELADVVDMHERRPRTSLTRPLGGVGLSRSA